MERGNQDPMLEVQPVYGVVSQIETAADAELLRELVSSYSSDILSLSFSYVRDFQQAEDITQEVFLRAYRNLSQFHGKSSYKTWLYSIAANCCKDYLRARKVRQVFWLRKTQEPPEYGRSAESEAIQTIEGDFVWKIVMQLSVKYREVIILHYKEDFSTSQIADVLGISEQTVRTRLFRARDMIKTLLEKEELNWMPGNKK